MTDTRTLAAMLLHLAGLMRVTNPSRFVTSFSVEDVEQMAADVQRAPGVEPPWTLDLRDQLHLVLTYHGIASRIGHEGLITDLIALFAQAARQSNVQRAPVPLAPAAMRKEDVEQMAADVQKSAAQPCSGGHVWSNHFGDDWRPDEGILCDCGQRGWQTYPPAIPRAPVPLAPPAMRIRSFNPALTRWRR